ncbi:hypothetical protein TNCV_5075441 [Trichonephila clavipes]|uniref:Uncharacterized protein n=1 Tax=Trichonephila clavipes TaxID=2585209 RepID=A0A8X6S173_TRICX|nr:hypothetical protein TNCV_5075441 [Trichonephila clavipes]
MRSTTSVRRTLLHPTFTYPHYSSLVSSNTTTDFPESYVEGQLAPTPRRYSAGCLKYQQCVLEECESPILEESRVISNTAAYHNILCRTSVVVHNAAVQHPLSTVSPDSNPTIVVLQTDA